MIKSEYSAIEITGLSVAVPTNKVLVKDFSSKFGEEAVANFTKMTGVESYYKSSDKQTASDLGYIAAKNLLERKQLDVSSIGILIFVTQSPDYKIPATACVLHKRLGLSKECIAYDVNLGCSGYVYGLNTVYSQLQSSNAIKALLIVGDTSSKAISPEDKSSVMLFGDSGSATLVEKVPSKNGLITKIALRTIGDGYRAIIQQAGGYRNPVGSFDRTVWADGNNRNDYELYMDGAEVFNFTITEVPSMIQEVISDGNPVDNIDFFVFHQANLFILKQIAKRLKVSFEKVLISINTYGNTSVTSIPLTLARHFGEDSSEKGIRLLMSGFGVGLSLGVVVTEINLTNILPIVHSDDYYTEGGIIRG